MKTRAGRITYCAIALVALGQLGISIYTPSLPPMATALATTPGEIASTLTTYLLAFGAAQLGLGPLSERFGRMPVMAISLAIFLLGAVASGCATSASALGMARLFQGFGAGGASAIARILLRDRFSGPHLQIALSKVSMGIVLVPLLAPIMGGYIELWAGWRHQFTTMAIAAAACWWWCSRNLQESTLELQRASFRYLDIPRGYISLLKSHQFLAFAGLAACVYGCTTVYYLSAPFIFQNQIGMPPELYGWMPVPTVLSYIAGTNFAIVLNRRGKGNLCIPVGVITMAAGSLAMVVTAQWPAHGVAIAAPMALIMVGEGLVLPAALGHALTQKAAAAGYTAAGVGAFQMVGAGAVSTVVEVLPEATHLSLALSLLALSAGCVLTYLATRLKHVQHYH